MRYLIRLNRFVGLTTATVPLCRSSLKEMAGAQQQLT